MIKLTSRYTIKKAEPEKIYDLQGNLINEVMLDNRLFAIWDNQENKAVIYISHEPYSEIDWIRLEQYENEYHTVFLPSILEKALINGSNYIWCLAIDLVCQEKARQSEKENLYFFPDSNRNDVSKTSYYGYLDMMIQIVGKDNAIDYYEKAYALVLAEKDDQKVVDKGIHDLEKIKEYITSYREEKFN